LPESDIDYTTNTISHNVQRCMLQVTIKLD